MKKIVLFVFLTFCQTVIGFSQEEFREEINNFLHEDSISFPTKGSILFVGSSSFRLWKNVQQDFPSYKIINRGFGGSTLKDVSYYEDQIIFRYDPGKIVIYCGENDVAGGVSGTEVFERFKKLYSDIRAKWPAKPVAYVSMKPSPSRIKFKTEVEKGNALIQQFLLKDKNAKFIDVYRLMLTKEGSPKEELFIEDQLHMNEKGYAIWKEAILPFLKK